MQRAVRLSVLDHLAGDAVLLGEAGVEVVQLGEDAAVETARQPCQLNQRRLADGIHSGCEQCVVSCHANPLMVEVRKVSLPANVTPAKAGVQRLCLDSRFRGNDVSRNPFFYGPL